MNLASTIWIYAGGPGSGCTGPNCGRPSTGINYLAQKLGGAKGSNEGGTYKGNDGVVRYVKFYKDPAQAKGEVLANKIYRDLKLGAPQSTLLEHNGKTAFASELLEGKKLASVPLTKEVANKVLDGFAADILTANWDAVGLGHDNVLVKGNSVYRIDQGGTFLKRAQGGQKPANLLNEISEFHSLLDPTINQAYASVGRAAGIKSGEQLGNRLSSQVAAIVSLRDRSGGWDAYVAKNAPFLQGSDRDKIVGMLNSRTKLLEKVA